MVLDGEKREQFTGKDCLGHHPRYGRKYAATATRDLGKLLMPIPNRFAFVITEHEGIRAFHDLARQDHIGSILFNL
jgi:hypothetical protein